jgi:hypothetical protein
MAAGMEIAMVTALRLLLASLPLLCVSGCSWLPYLGRNLVGTPLEAVESCCFDVTMHFRARKAWRDIVASSPAKEFSSAYGDGFCNGFVDYVRRGGTGEPPAIPPMCYRYPVLRTPEQQQAIDDWFAGFRHGSAVAREQGWREGVVIPISQPSDIAPVVFKQEIIPTTQALPEIPSPPGIEQLAPPRQAPVDISPPRPLAISPFIWLGPRVPVRDYDWLHAMLKR